MLAVLTMCSVVLAEGSYVKVEWLGSYVCGNGFQAYENPVWQSEIGHEFKNGFGFSIWNSLPASLQNIGDNAGTEVDVNAWYDLGPLILGVSYFSVFPDSKAFYKNDVWQLNADGNKDFDFDGIVVTPGLRVELNLPVDGAYNRQNTGFYLIPRLNLSAKLNEQWQANIMTKFEVDFGGYGAEKALIVLISPGLTWKISKTVTVDVGVNMYFPTFEKNGDPRENEFIPRVGIFKSF